MVDHGQSARIAERGVTIDPYPELICVAHQRSIPLNIG
jgi:hypothetical protein